MEFTKLDMVASVSSAGMTRLGRRLQLGIPNVVPKFDVVCRGCFWRAPSDCVPVVSKDWAPGDLALGDLAPGVLVPGNFAPGVLVPGDLATSVSFVNWSGCACGVVPEDAGASLKCMSVHSGCSDSRVVLIGG